MAFSRDEIDYFLNRKVTENYTYYDSVNKSEKKLEAFLLQSTLLEGVLTQLLTVTFQKRRIDYLKQTFNSLNETIRSLHMLIVIDENEFKALNDYKQNRNRIVHRLLDQNYNGIELTARKYYENGTDILLTMIKKLKRDGH